MTLLKGSPPPGSSCPATPERTFLAAAAPKTVAKPLPPPVSAHSDPAPVDLAIVRRAAAVYVADPSSSHFAEAINCVMCTKHLLASAAASQANEDGANNIRLIHIALLTHHARSSDLAEAFRMCLDATALRGAYGSREAGVLHVRQMFTCGLMFENADPSMARLCFDRGFDLAKVVCGDGSAECLDLCSLRRKQGGKGRLLDVLVPGAERFTTIFLTGRITIALW